MSWWDTNLLDPVHELHCVWVIEFLQLGQFWQDPWKILEQWRGREQQFIIENGSQHHVHNVTFSLLHVSGIGPISNYIHFIMCMLKVLKVFYYCERFYEYILCRVHFRGIKKTGTYFIRGMCLLLTSLHRLKPMMVGTAVLRIKACRRTRESSSAQTKWNDKD